MTSSGYRPWLGPDIRYLKNNYPTESNDHIAGYLGRSLAAINGQARQLGLKKTPEYLLNRVVEKSAERRAIRPVINVDSETQFIFARVPAKLVKLPGLEKYDFAVHWRLVRKSAYRWICTELSTGIAIGRSENSSEAAARNALIRISKDPESFDRMIRNHAVLSPFAQLLKSYGEFDDNQ